MGRQKEIIEIKGNLIYKSINFLPLNELTFYTILQKNNLEKIMLPLIEIEKDKIYAQQLCDLNYKPILHNPKDEQWWLEHYQWVNKGNMTATLEKNIDWLNACLEYYGKEFFDKFVMFVNAFTHGDCFASSNHGYVDGRPVIFDI